MSEEKNINSNISSLDDEYKELLDTIEHYPAQIKQSWREVNSINFPQEYKDVLNVVVCGMGGSTLGARMIKSLLVDRFKVPFEIVNDYQLPYFAEKKSLVIVSSYSGGTEETISCANEAKNKHVRLFGITTGSHLAEILKSAGVPYYIFDPVNNPSGQPRNATGYFIGSFIALFSKLNLVDVDESEVLNAISSMENLINEVKNDKSEFTKTASNYARKLKGKIPVIVSSEHLYGVAHIFKNQLNESAKTFSVHFPIPELNHHLMEGLKNPKKQKKILNFVFFNSDLYSDKIQKRYQLTKEIVNKNSIDTLTYQVKSEGKLEQSLELMVFGALVVKNLSQMYKENPSSIPWVDYFKEKLKDS